MRGQEGTGNRRVHLFIILGKTEPRVGTGLPSPEFQVLSEPDLEPSAWVVHPNLCPSIMKTLRAEEGQPSGFQTVT